MSKKNLVKLIVSIVVSVIFLILIYRKVDLKVLTSTLEDVNYGYFGLYIALFVPQILVTSIRWKYILEKVNLYPISLYKSFQMVVGSYTANLIIPAKMGEIVRIFWVDKSKSKFPPLVLILFEKLWDILSVYSIFFIAFTLLQFETDRFRQEYLIASGVTLIGLIIGVLIFQFVKPKEKPNESVLFRVINLINKFWRESRNRFIPVLLWSLVLWLIQVAQFYFMFKTFDIHLPVSMAFAGGALAILAGAVIISIGGIGPRDATIIWFFGALVSTEILVSIGIISALRIVIPALFGLPYFISLSIKRKSWNN